MDITWQPTFRLSSCHLQRPLHWGSYVGSSSRVEPAAGSRAAHKPNCPACQTRDENFCTSLYVLSILMVLDAFAAQHRPGFYAFQCEPVAVQFMN